MITSIFISKDSEDVPVLRQFCNQHKIVLHAQSLIAFESVPFRVEQSYDVLFFSSIRSAHFFLKQAAIPNNVVVACIGETTADKLKLLGIIPDFIGEKSGNPIEVTQAFKQWLGKRTVLIPQSDKSAQTISLFLPEEHYIACVVYRTLLNCKPVDNSDVYVFTSPSNAESFLQCNPTPEGKIIAWGETTKQFLLQKEIPPFTKLETSTIGELIVRINELL